MQKLEGRSDVNVGIINFQLAALTYRCQHDMAPAYLFRNIRLTPDLVSR